MDMEMVGACIAALVAIVFVIAFSHWYRNVTKGGGW